MEASEFIFNGKRFRYPQDFEQEFKPTKWSIRKFMIFIKNLDDGEKWNFAIHTLKMYDYYFRPEDKDTLNFIRQIKEKKRNGFNISNGKSSPYSKLTVDKNNYDLFIKLMVILQKDKIINGLGVDIADLLKNKFGVKLSKSTISSKIYKFSEELNEKNFNKETFNIFHSLCVNI